MAERAREQRSRGRAAPAGTNVDGYDPNGVLAFGYVRAMDNSTSHEGTPFPRDRSGEIFENDLTEENEATPVEREEGAEQLHGDPDVDSQAADEFMKDRKFSPTPP